jgi:signal transduction histidine kinase
VTEAIMKVATNRSVNFNFSIENQTVLCDEKVIRNVFRRLIHNAAKFAEHSTDVEVTGRSLPNGRYEVAIANRGQPIDEKRIAQLMKPFTLNENTLNHSVGTGLGLSICQAMLKLHSSRLKFVSASGSGAAGASEPRIIVSFELPLV